MRVLWEPFRAIQETLTGSSERFPQSFGCYFLSVTCVPANPAKNKPFVFLLCCGPSQLSVPCTQVNKLIIQMVQQM